MKKAGNAGTKAIRTMRSGRAGSALVIALIFLAFGSLVLPGLAVLAESSLKQGTFAEKQGKQSYTADAGTESAIWWIRYADHYANPLPSTVGQYVALPLAVDSPVSLKRKSYVTYLGKQGAADLYQVKSVAGPTIADNANRDAAQLKPYSTVNAEVTYIAPTAPTFSYGVVALNGNVTIDNNGWTTSSPAVANGNVFANGNISVGENASILGSAAVTSGHSITVGSGGAISGRQTVGSTQAFTRINTSVYKSQAQAAQSGTTVSGPSYSAQNKSYVINNANTHMTGNLNLGNNSSLVVNGNLYIDGNVTLINNVSLTVKGTLYVGGYLTSGNGATLNLGGSTYINGTLTLDNNNALSGDYVVVARSDVTFQNNSFANVANAPVFASEQGNINVSNNVSVCAYLYAPNGTVTLSNNGAITGSVVGRAVTLDDNASVVFTTSERDDLPGPATPVQLTVITWDASSN